MQKKDLINKFYLKQNLNQKEAETLMLFITENQFSEIEIAMTLMFYKTHNITINELIGFRKILLEKCLKFNISFNAIDVCGTGGDGKNTFNISTLTALVIAGAGYKVVKHGNYGVSSTSGSSNVLEYLGYKFTTKEEILNDQLQENNICFLHAPLFHPALKNVGPVRKAFAAKTIFNLLGPLINPCNISHQFIGVSSLDILRSYHYLLQRSNSNYCLVHSIDGYDEISLTDTFKIISPLKESIIHPLEIGIPLNTEDSLFSGESVKEAASIFMDVLQDKATTSQKNAVLVNAAFAIQLINNKPLQECLLETKESLESKKPLTLFKNLTSKHYEYTY